MQRGGVVLGNPGTPPPMKTVSGKDRKEVVLPSQEGKQGVMQYALYVTPEPSPAKTRVGD